VTTASQPRDVSAISHGGNAVRVRAVSVDRVFSLVTGIGLITVCNTDTLLYEVMMMRTEGLYLKQRVGTGLHLRLRFVSGDRCPNRASKAFATGMIPRVDVLGTKDSSSAHVPVVTRIIRWQGTVLPGS
jgi:hypothetical protein